jgi:hypothetical protein
MLTVRLTKDAFFEMNQKKHMIATDSKIGVA